MLTVQWCLISYLKKKNNSCIFSHIQPMHYMDGIDEEYNYNKNRFMILFKMYPQIWKNITRIWGTLKPVTLKQILQKLNEF